MERWAGADGLMQRLDARVKVVAVLALVVAASCVRSVWPLVGLYGVCLALAALSRVPVGVLIRRVWPAVPLFVGAVTLPAALNIVTPGRALLVLHRDPYLAVTAPGLALAGLLTLRVGVAMSFVALLPLTTRWSDLLAGLRGLLVPRLFVTALAMTYRYLGVLTQSAEEMFTARRSRTVGRSSRADDRRFVGGAIGALFGKTVALTDEVHAAMLSRGWTGEARALSARRIAGADAAWLAAMLVLAALAALAAGGGRIG